MRELEGRVGVVTGAPAESALPPQGPSPREGMRVVLADIQEDALAKAESELSAAGHEVLAVPTDVSKWEQVEQLAVRTLERFGAVHVLHNNAEKVMASLERFARDVMPRVTGLPPNTPSGLRE